MFVGIPPSFHRNKHRMYHFIKESKVNFPDPERHKITVSETAKDLILKLLDKDKRKRLGCNGVEEILGHPWFKDLDLEKLQKRELAPSYKPELSHDLAYFDQKLIISGEMTESVVPQQQRAIIKTEQHQFKGFSS